MFWTVVLGKTLESPLDCKVKPVNPKKKKKKKKKSVLSIHWKGWCWSWSSNTLATWCEERTHWENPWCWERLRARKGGDKRGWNGWRASLNGHESEWTQGNREGQGSLPCCSLWGESDMTWQLNNHNAHAHTQSPIMTSCAHVKTGKFTLFRNIKIGSNITFSFEKQGTDYPRSQMNNCLQWGERKLWWETSPRWGQRVALWALTDISLADLTAVTQLCAL